MGVRSADTASVRALLAAHRMLNDLGGSLELARPQSAVVKMLALIGVDQVLTIRTQARTGPEPTAR